MKPFFFSWDYRDLRRFVFATLATLLCVMYMGTFPTPRLSASVSVAPQSVATYGVQGIIPWYSYDVIHQLTGYDNQVVGSTAAQRVSYTYDPQGTAW